MSTIYIDRGNALVDFDKDTKNFIDATGLNSDSNLNVEGLYDAAKARYAAHLWVSGLKKIGAWTLTDAFHPMLGGTDNIAKYSLKNPSNTDAAGRLIYIDGSVGGGELGNGYYLQRSVVHNVNKYGFQGNALIGNLNYNSSHTNNLSLGQYVYSVPLTSGHIYVGTNATGVITYYNDSVNYSALFGTSFYLTPNDFAKGSFYGSFNGANQSSLSIVVKDLLLPLAFGGTTFGTPANTPFAIGFNGLTGTISTPNNGTTARVNCTLVAKYLTPNQLRAISNLNEYVNAMLGRSILR